MNSVNDLVSYLKKCDDAYYNSDTTLVSNDTYDSLVQTLKNLDPDNPYLNKVGADPRKGSSKVGRLVPMGTLSKYHKDDDVKAWLSEQDCNIIIAPKYDGFGVELTYIDGELVMASTRGNGYTGEDVTEAMKCVNYVPHTLPDEFKGLKVVRGEAIIPRVNHEIIKSLGYAAMRNAVPGIVRSCNYLALRYVDFIAYEFFDGDHHRSSQRARYMDIFNIEEWQPYNSQEFVNILEYRNDFGSEKDSYTYEVDGMVIKTEVIRSDDLSCPEHQIAWKFESKRRETILRSIEFQLGVTGKFTPIGIFDEVEFQGAKLSRASLGSMDRYYSLKPCVGDIIEVSRRGDIIPYIEEVTTYQEDGFFKVLEFCPHCGSELVDNMCLNKECPEKVRLQIMYYVGSIGVKGIGPSLVRGLVDKGIIKNLSDVYNVKEEDILSIPRQGQSAVTKWKAFIDKEIGMSVFLSALPFDNIGPKTWDMVLSKWTFEDMLNLTETDLLNAGIKGLGESKVNDLVRQIRIYKDDIVKMRASANIR